MVEQHNSAGANAQTQHWVDVLLADSDSDETLERLVREAAKLFDVPIAMINILTEETIIFKACVGQAQGDCLDRDGSFCDVAISQEPPLKIVDASKDERFKNYDLVTRGIEVRSYLGKSLHAPDGNRLGTFCLLDVKPRNYTKFQETVLASFVESAEQAIAELLRGRVR